MNRDFLKRLILAILVFGFSGLLLAGADILEFRADPSVDKTLLYWKTGQENGVDLFWVERSLDNKTFVKIGEVEPKGSDSEYQYIDENLSELKNIFYYRIHVRNSDGSSQYSETVMVIPNISSIKRTWGSIKALFR